MQNHRRHPEFVGQRNCLGCCMHRPFCSHAQKHPWNFFRCLDPVLAPDPLVNAVVHPPEKQRAHHRLRLSQPGLGGNVVRGGASLPLPPPLLAASALHLHLCVPALQAAFHPHCSAERHCVALRDDYGAAESLVGVASAAHRGIRLRPPLAPIRRKLSS